MNQGFIRSKQCFMASLTLLFVSFNIRAAPVVSCQWKSPPHRMVVAELYTSEGCSSCPPADRWLSKQFKPSSVSQQVLPLAFHIDYWDYIGWKDPYGSAVHTKRQQLLRQRGNTRAVYTPQFVLSGQEFRDWGDTDLFKRLLNQAALEEPLIHIHLQVEKKPNSDLGLKIRVEPTHHETSITGNLLIAIYEDGLKQEVRAGENRGANLKHDGVVRTLLGPYAVIKGQANLTVPVDLSAEWNKPNVGIGIFVEQGEGRSIIQALNAPRLFSNCAV